MKKTSIVYIAVCEVLLGLLFSMLIIVIFVEHASAKNGTRAWVYTASFAAVALLSFIVALGMMCRRRWAWYGSWVICAIGVMVGCWIVWAAAHASPYGDGGEAVIFAIPIFGLALPACWMMVTSDVQDFVASGTAAI